MTLRNIYDIETLAYCYSPVLFLMVINQIPPGLKYIRFNYQIVFKTVIII